ncbi:hypothetical protein B566_EDAN008933 [Ephemera danica]|nr:hypothetical protein B566_EDAN008933 [Ephemera danica]
MDTDGIWCVLPASFPENFEITTTNPKKPKVVISYPNAVLNLMVKENYTNHQYQELNDADKLKYEKRSENSIFFEVDGPYRAMVLPASKEEGKRLKKRYAVFNDDGSLAELKGFEVKRRGELRLIKVFQGSVFEAFLKGDTLEECYANVAKVADYWLDVLYTKASNLSDNELMDLVSENRSMSKKLEEYGAQKSTSISTAKRLAEFLGDQMVKDAGLSCRFIVSRQPEGSPVTERAVPVAIFQAEESVRRHYLCRWLKDSTLENLNIRSVLDWNYYIERLGGCIQKIVTIPAAMQGVTNPVPRVRHPDWLHRRLNEKGDARKQRKIDVMFQKLPPRVLQGEGEEDIDDPEVRDIEDIGTTTPRPLTTSQANKRKRTPENRNHQNSTSNDWRTALGPPPPKYHKRKWAMQAAQRKQQQRHATSAVSRAAPQQGAAPQAAANTVRGPRGSLGSFLRRAQQTLLNSSWHVIQLAKTNEAGVFRVWALVGAELHQVRVVVPRVFYVNQHQAMPEERKSEEDVLWRPVNRTLPRGRPMLHLYRYSVPEEQFQQHTDNLLGSLATPDVEGIYETQVSLEFRTLLQLGCMCGVMKGYQEMGDGRDSSFSLEQLQAKGLQVGDKEYLSSGSLHALCLCIMRAPLPSPRALLALMIPPSKRAVFIAVDSVRTNQMPNIQAIYTAERNARLNQGSDEDLLPPPELSVEVRVETDLKMAFRSLQRVLQTFKDEKKGPSYVALQSNLSLSEVMALLPGLAEFPVVPLECQGFGEDSTRASLKAETLEILSRLEWQRLGSRAILRRYLDAPMNLDMRIRQCRYLHIPLGNLPPQPSDAYLFATDLMFARHLLRQNFLLCLVSDAEQGCSVTVNNPGCYSNVCVELLVDALAVDALIQSERINNVEGTSSSVAFDRAQPMNVSTLAGASQPVGPILSNAPSETAICSGAFRVLKAMVGAWIRDVGLHQNVFADFQITYFYRWLCSPQTLLYDPALRQGLQLLMKKLFLQLVAEFRRMGAVIVYANLSRIILSTRKNTIPDALNYMEFIIHSVKNKELFHSIGLQLRDCWEHLLWLGPTNYGGIKGKVPEEAAGDVVKSASQKMSKRREEGEDEEGVSDSEEENSSSEEEEDDNMPEVEMDWSLARSLPLEAGCRENFNALVIGYLSSTYLKTREALAAKMGDTPIRKRTMSQPTPLGSVQQLNRKLPSNLGRKKSLSQSLTRSSIHLSDTDGVSSSPALDFTKAICRVLELDNTVAAEVGALRRNMLRLIGVSEFSDAAEWSEPCLSVTLNEVLCQNCNYCHELDLVRNCRWDELEDPGDGTTAWKCPLCHIGYENEEIEYLVLETFNRRVMSYNLQDLQCSRCQQVKMENMPLRCSCAAPFRTQMDSKQLTQFMVTLANVAECFNMPMLAETIHWAQTVGLPVC